MSNTQSPSTLAISAQSAPMCFIFGHEVLDASPDVCIHCGYQFAPADVAPKPADIDAPIDLWPTS